MGFKVYPDIHIETPWRSANTLGRFYSVVYDPIHERYVGCGPSGLLGSSINGLDWTFTTVSGDYRGLACNPTNGRVVALRYYYSPPSNPTGAFAVYTDNGGLSWTQVPYPTLSTPPASWRFNALAFANGRFAAGTYNTSSSTTVPNVCWSTNGVNWNFIRGPATSGTAGCTLHGANNLFFAEIHSIYAGTGTTRIDMSSDVITWQQGSGRPLYSAGQMLYANSNYRWAGYGGGAYDNCFASSVTGNVMVPTTEYSEYQRSMACIGYGGSTYISVEGRTLANDGILDNYTKSLAVARKSTNAVLWSDELVPFSADFGSMAVGPDRFVVPQNSTTSLPVTIVRPLAYDGSGSLG